MQLEQCTAMRGSEKQTDQRIEKQIDQSTELPRPRFIANFALALGGQVAAIAIGLLTEVCFARLLGPAPRGQISLCTMAISFGALFGGLGGEVPIVILSASNTKKTSEWLSAVFLWGFVGCALAEVSWFLLERHWHSSSLQGITPALGTVILLSIPLAILFNYLLAFLGGQERFRERAILGCIEGAGTLAGFLFLAWLYARNANAAMWGNWLGLVVGLLAAVTLLRKTLLAGWSIPRANQEIRSVLLVGLYGNFGNITSFFNYRLDVFIVNYFLNPAQVGIYAVGVTVSESLWQIPQAVASALFPRSARTVENGATEFTCLILRQVLLISCFSGFLLAALAPIVMPLFFGARFAPSVPVIWWIIPGTIALALGKVAASDLAGRRKTFYTSIFGIVALVVTVALDLLLIPRMGIQGAALASSIAYAIYGALLVAALRHELKVTWRTLLVPPRVELARYKQLVINLLGARSATRASS
jgi:O-antigen/teichoic acid export membrane protein